MPRCRSSGEPKKRLGDSSFPGSRLARLISQFSRLDRHCAPAQISARVVCTPEATANPRAVPVATFRNSCRGAASAARGGSRRPVRVPRNGLPGVKGTPHERPRRPRTVRAGSGAVEEHAGSLQPPGYRQRWGNLGVRAAGRGAAGAGPGDVGDGVRHVHRGILRNARDGVPGLSGGGVHRSREPRGGPAQALQQREEETGVQLGRFELPSGVMLGRASNTSNHTIRAGPARRILPAHGYRRLGRLWQTRLTPKPHNRLRSCGQPAVKQNRTRTQYIKRTG